MVVDIAFAVRDNHDPGRAVEPFLGASRGFDPADAFLVLDGTPLPGAKGCSLRVQMRAWTSPSTASSPASTTRRG